MENKSPLVIELEKKFFKSYPVTDFRDLLYKTTEKNKKHFAFKLKDENGKIYGVTYEQFKTDVESIGTMLLKLGLAGKAISVIGKNSYNWSVSYLAASIIGIVVPIDKELHINDITNFLNASESKAIIGDSKYIKNVKENSEKVDNKDLIYIKMDNKEKVEHVLNFNNVKKDGEELLKQGNTSFRDLKINPDELHILLFTSGTTGNAKGVCLSQTNIISNIISTASIVKVDHKIRVLSILPIHHTYECTLGFLLIIYGGGCITYCDGLKYITKNIQEYKPTVILCVPLLLENVYKKIHKTFEKILAKRNLPANKITVDNLPFFLKPIVKTAVKKSLGGKMTRFIVGAAAINPAIVDAFFKLGIPVLQGYGLTECSPLVAGNNDFYHRNEAAGLPIPNVEYKISNPDSQGIGEIIVKGPNVMLGYYKNQEETDRVLKDGWFYTGDLGKVDEDGYLYITGRCKTVIVTKNGKNIYPEEIEYYLNESPYVEESMVLGVNYENDNETYVNAQIFPNLEAIKEKLHSDNPSKEDIQSVIKTVVQNANSQLPNYKHIKKFHIRDTEFEKTTTRKIKRFGDNLKI